MNPARIELLRPAVEAETGMDFSGSRFARLCEAVEKTLTKEPVADLDRVLADPQAWNLFLERLTSQLTVGESFFFRNEHHFRALREVVFPEIQRTNHDRRQIRVWSAGCSTGEEPYSLAILLDQLLGTAHDHWSVSILATDINLEFLRRARQGEYRAWSFRRTEIHSDPSYFQTVGDKSRLCSRVRDRVRFLYLNLVKDVYPSPATGTLGLDLILFRNVAIYLHDDVIRAIVERFRQCLHPGGWLLLGEAEVSHVQPDGFDVRRIGPATFFQKPMQEPQAPSRESLAEPPRPVLPALSAPVARQPGQRIGAETRGRPPRLPQVAEPQQQREFDTQRLEACLSRRDYAAAESELAALGDRENRAVATLQYVRRLLELAHVSRARQVLDDCLKQNPMSVDVHLLKAGLAEEQGELSAAEAACRRALYLDRSCVMAHFQLAMIQQQAGDVAGARKSLQTVQDFAGSRDANALVEHGDGVCYGRLGEMARSMMES